MYVLINESISMSYDSDKRKIDTVGAKNTHSLQETKDFFL